MRTRFACLLGLLVLIPASKALGAQDPAVPAPEPPMRTVSGTVVSSTSSSLVITTDVGIEQAFTADDQSTITRGLAPGVRVTVRYRALPGGRYYAARVTLGDPGTTDEPPAGAGTGATTPPEDVTPPRQLPATSSVLPLLVVIGLAALAWGLAFRALARTV